MHRPFWRLRRNAIPTGQFAAFPASDLRTFGLVKPVGLLAVQNQAFPAQHHMQTQVPVSPVPGGQFLHALNQSRIIRAHRLMLVHRTRQPNQAAGAPFAEPSFLRQEAHDFSFGHGLTNVFQEILHGGHVQHLICNDPFQLRVLCLKGLQSLRVTGFHAAVLLAPGIKCG